MEWIWDDVKKFFVNIADAISEALGFKSLVGLRDDFADAAMLESDKLIEQLMRDGTTDIQTWLTDMRDLVKNTYRAEYELAIGGRGNMTQADYGRLGGILQEQYKYLQGFADDLAQGKLTIGQAQYRARMYIDSATQAFERAKAAGYGLDLPQYPGDGATQCLSNCRCNWEIKENSLEWLCFWRLGEAEHCPDCLDAKALYSPYVVSKGVQA